MGWEVPTLPGDPTVGPWQDASRCGPAPALQRKCTNFLINLIWKSKAFSFRSCPAPGSLMDTRQGWRGAKHGPACRRAIKLSLLKGRKRSVTALGRAAAGVKVLREQVRPGNLLQGGFFSFHSPPFCRGTEILRLFLLACLCFSAGCSRGDVGGMASAVMGAWCVSPPGKAR